MPVPNVSRQVVGSSIVTSAAQLEILATYLNVIPSQLRLTTLFSTNVQGWSATQFHTACDKQGATITLVKSGGLFHGGYASVSWVSSDQVLQDSEAFLFRFKCEKHIVTDHQQFQRTGNNKEIYAYRSYGPVFGSKHDFFAFGDNQRSLSDVNCTGLVSFNTPNGFYYTSTAQKEKSSVLEVMKVETSDLDLDEELEEPWVTAFPWEAQAVTQLKNMVFKYDPKQAGLSVPSVNILLCGGVGAGKSSVVSTIDSICKGRISRRAPHGQGTGSLTRMLRKYKFTQPDTDGDVKWQLWDSMGWGNDDYKRGELAFILDGNLPDKCDLSGSISTKTKGFIKEPSLADRVHCVLFVVPCSAATDEAYMARLHEMRQFAREREIPTLICLTKVDAYDPDVIGEDLARTFHSSRLLDLVEELEETAGVGGRKDILPVKNLSNEMGPTTELSALMCKALEQCLYAAEDYITEYGSTLRSELSD